VVVADWVGQNNLLTAQRAASLPGRIDRLFPFLAVPVPAQLRKSSGERQTNAIAIEHVAYLENRQRVEQSP
jgi:hypothetical protein